MPQNNTIAVLAMPAYGHMNSILSFMEKLVQNGFRVVCWSVEQFRAEIVKTGSEYRSYRMDWNEIDLSDGKRLWKLYRMELEYTLKFQDTIYADVAKEQPFCILHDGLALWGRIFAEEMGLPSGSFYSLFRVGGFFDAGMRFYMRGFFQKKFMMDSELLDLSEIRKARVLKKQLKAVLQKRGVQKTKLGFLPSVMSPGTIHVMNYSALLLPASGRDRKKSYYIGPGSVQQESETAYVPPQDERPLIYVSLGTIAIGGADFWKQIVAQFANSKYRVLISNRNFPLDLQALPENITVKGFVNQHAALAQASLIISAGGLNSMQEAIAHRVPCLGIPQQGEQYMAIRRVEALGFCKMLNDISNLYAEAEQAIRLKDTWREEVRAALSADHADDAIACIKGWANKRT